MWECKKCGKCCMVVGFYAGFLNRGDGVCKNFDMSSKLCKVYDDRPLICRVDDMYEQVKDKFISKEHYYKFQKNMCDKAREVK